jgi:choline dehydrogenase
MAEFDYLVVGAGSAGCVVAARLSEDAGIHVGVLEAGTRPTPQVAEDIDIPWHWGLVPNHIDEHGRTVTTGVDWGYRSVPQAHCYGKRFDEPRGKLPGGSSNLYILMHIRGHRSDYDNWAYNGCPGWSFDDVLPYFQKLEDQEDDTNPLAGKGGPLRVASVERHDPNPVSRAFIDACIELGHPRTEDFNGPHMVGVGWHHVNIKDGKRDSDEKAYLYPALDRERSKPLHDRALELIDGAQATRLLFTDASNRRRCTGVEYVRDGRTATATASREVIVCAGAIDSPKLLLLSGIGLRERLEALGIPALVDLPGVGENFHNHVLVPVICEARQPIPRPHNNMSEAALFYRSQPGWPGPDMQMAFVHGIPQAVKEERPPNRMVMLPGVVRPLSRGRVRLASADPLASPLIDPNYLAVEADHHRLTEAVRLARKIYKTRALADWVQAEVLPGPSVSDAELGDNVRNRAESYHHQAGSCRMGLDALAVVDPDLRVHGIEGLRVADASVMPTVPSGNCHAGVIMIGEKCADLVKTARARA